MDYLLDTHIFLWWLENDRKLKSPLRDIIQDNSNNIFVSVVSGLEISIKQKIGKLPLKTTVKTCFEKSEFGLLDVRLKHIIELDKLPVIHKDPFDRMLIAQAKAEKLTLLTDDVKIKRYKISILN